MTKSVTCKTCKGTYPAGATVCPKDGTPLQSSAQPADPLRGQVLDGRYRIGERLSVGGMGVVYRAEHLHLGRTVVVKLLHRHLAQEGTEGEFFRRFQREAKMASQIEHPNAIVVYDFGTFDNRPYLVMQFNRGRNLKLVLAESGAMPEKRAIAILAQVGEAVAAAHRLKIIHRDLKPENIMITVDECGVEHAQVLDFGIAKVVSDTEKENDMTRTGIVLGTPYYMAPEQALAAEVDVRTEVYTLGVMLYEMLTGVVPFSADSPMKVMMLHLKEKPVPFRTANPQCSCSAGVEAVVMKALKKEPGNRYQSVPEFIAALEHALDAQAASPGEFAREALGAGESHAARNDDTAVPRRGRSMVAIGSLVFIAGTMGFALNPVLEYFSADAIARRALEAKKTEEAAEHTKRGKALAKSGNTKAAAYEFSRALELEPESAATYLNLGRLYSSALQDDEALVVLEKAVDLDSGNEEAQFLLANVHFRRNECDEAVRGYEKVLALNAKNKDAKKNLQTCNDYLRPKGTKGG